MSAPRWDGKIYRPTKPSEGLQPGTLDWKEKQEQRRARVERAIDRRAERELLREQARQAEEERNRMKSDLPDGLTFAFWSALGRLWNLIRHR
jgi:hypothetical protein